MRLLIAICFASAMLLHLVAVAMPARAAAPCGGDFGAWLAGRQAGSRGRRHFAAPPSNRRLAGVTYDPTIIARDHAQGVFRQSFEQFSGRMVPPRLARARQKMLVIRLAVEPHRAAIRRARRGHRRHLGTGNRFRRRYRPFPDHPLAGDAGLRLPPAGQIPRRTDRRAAHRRSRRHDARRTCAAPGPARSDRPSSCRRPI